MASGKNPVFVLFDSTRTTSVKTFYAGAIYRFDLSTKGGVRAFDTVQPHIEAGTAQKLTEEEATAHGGRIAKLNFPGDPNVSGGEGAEGGSDPKKGAEGGSDPKKGGKG